MGRCRPIDHSRSLPPEQQFVWTVPGWPLKEMLWPGQTPERRAKIVQAIKEGRLTVHAMPFSLQTESLDLEDLVRGMTFSADLARENGLPLPRAAKMTDVPEHTWVLPTLLETRGGEFPADRLQRRQRARCACRRCSGGKARTGRACSRFIRRNMAPPLLPPQDWPYHTWLAMIMTGDNHGPPTTEDVDKLLRQAAKEMPGVKIKFGRLEDFYDAIMAEKNDNIPVVRGDMPDTWIHGFEAMPMETKLAWNVRPLEGAVAMLDTELRAAGVNPPPLAQALARAYENSLLYSEHTFGFYGSQPGGFWYGEEWKQKLAEGAYDRFLQILRGQKRLHPHHRQHRHQRAGRADAVAGAKRGRRRAAHRGFQSAAVEAERRSGNSTADGRLDGRARFDQRHGSWKLSAVDGRTLRFVANDVPPGGYKTFQPVADAVAKEQSGSDAGVIENKFFRLKVDAARGGLVSLVDLQTGRELVATTGRKQLWLLLA